MSTALTQMIARLLLAPLCIVAAAFLVKGLAGPGDGFAAGMTAALAVLIQYLAFGPAGTERMLPLRHAPAAAFGGLLIAVAVAAEPLLRGDPLLAHLPAAAGEPAKVGTLELTTSLAFDVGILLLVLGAALGAVHAVARADWEQEDDGEAEGDGEGEGR